MNSTNYKSKSHLFVFSIFLILSMIVLTACASTGSTTSSQANTSSNSSSASSLSSSKNSSSLVLSSSTSSVTSSVSVKEDIQSFTGTLTDIGMNQMYVELKNGSTISFVYMDADISKLTDTHPGAIVKVSYTGELKGTDATGITVISVEDGKL